MHFSEWYKFRESSLRDILKVPQDPSHHSEGDVDHHTFMVRKSIEKAINQLRNQQKENPTGQLKNLDLNLSPQEYKTLRLAAWLHDIGKGEAFGKNEKGKITAIGHDDPEKYEKAMQKLGPVWQKMYQTSDLDTINDVKFIINNHMKVQSQKLGATLLDNEGNYKDNTRTKLLLIFWIMDRVGRGGSPDFSRKQRLDFISQNDDAANKATSKIYDLSQAVQAKRNAQIQQSKKKERIDDPSLFVRMLKSKGMDYNSIKKITQTKFNRPFTDIEIQSLIGESMASFRKFLENLEDEGHAIAANIPVDPEVEIIADLFKKNGKHLYVVGGAVRDYLFHQHDENPNKKAYKPKDIDLSTNASPEDIIKILASGNIRALPKGEAFGVISAIVNKKEYEIASFRSEWYDPESGDGRRPDKVQTGVSAKEDASRRDLTMNALFYDIADKKIVDFNLNHEGKGQGIEDIRNKVARPVGNPRDRFREDKLRIPRLIRFFSRFNTGEILSHLDKDTILAIEEFKDLKGVSPERVRAEFLAGLEKSLHPAIYLQNYQAFNLLTDVVFPGLNVATNDTKALDNTRDPIVVIAFLLRNNNVNEIREKLNKLTYPNNMVDGIEYLIRIMNFAFLNNQDQNNMKNTIAIIKNKDKVTGSQLKQFAELTGMDMKRILHLLNYQLPKIDSQALMSQGYKSNALGDQIRLQQMQHYHGDYGSQNN